MEYVMKYNFDEAVERRGTGCLKYDFAKERGKKEDVLPLWVADMDFKTAPAVTERLQKVVEHGIYGSDVPLFSPQNLQSRSHNGHLLIPDRC